MVLAACLKQLQPANYFSTLADRESIHTMAQISKDTHETIGCVLSNLELLMDSKTSPWILRGLLGRGLPTTQPHLKSALIGYFKSASQNREWDHVSTDLGHMLSCAQQQQDNCRLIVNGNFAFIQNFWVIIICSFQRL